MTVMLRCTAPGAESWGAEAVCALLSNLLSLRNLEDSGITWATLGTPLATTKLRNTNLALVLEVYS